MVRINSHLSTKLLKKTKHRILVKNTDEVIDCEAVDGKNHSLPKVFLDFVKCAGLKNDVISMPSVERK